MRAGSHATLKRNLLILESCEAILALSPMLEELAARCGQAGAMHWLSFFLDPAILGRRSPRLVLILSPEEDQGHGLKADDLQAAALFFEYEIFGLATGIVATGDAVGYNTVIAPMHKRAQVAALAARALLERGASMLMVTHDGAQNQEFSRWLPSQSAVLAASRTRHVPRMLPLRDTLDATLAQMGKGTRFNFRYYRRRLEKQLSCEFVAHAASFLHEADLDQLNLDSLNPVAPDEFRRRVQCASELRGSFLCGLRDASGRWLSLIGGWRQGETTVLYWQMNRAGMEKQSIGTVMRSYFLESEIGRGARALLIYGGTPHSMRHAFAEDSITDLVVQRRGLRTFALRSASRLLLATRLLRGGSFVLEAFCRSDLKWTSVHPHRALERAPAAFKSARAQRAA